MDDERRTFEVEVEIDHEKRNSNSMPEPEHWNYITFAKAIRYGIAIPRVVKMREPVEAKAEPKT